MGVLGDGGTRGRMTKTQTSYSYEKSNLVIPPRHTHHTRTVGERQRCVDNEIASTVPDADPIQVDIAGPCTHAPLQGRPIGLLNDLQVAHVLLHLGPGLVFLLGAAFLHFGEVLGVADRPVTVELGAGTRVGFPTLVEGRDLLVLHAERVVEGAEGSVLVGGVGVGVGVGSGGGRRVLVDGGGDGGTRGAGGVGRGAEAALGENEAWE